METKTSIRYFDVTVRADAVEEDVFPILQELRSQWNREDLLSEVYTKGMVNNMACYYHINDEERTDAIVVRVYGAALGDLNPREKEFMNLQIGHAAGCFPAIYATFNNGLMYKYAPGRHTNYHDIVNPQDIRTISRLLYHLHHIDIDKLHLVDRKGNPVTYDKTPFLFDQMKDYIAAIPEAPKDKKKLAKFRDLRKELSNEYLLEEYEFVKAIIDEVKPPICFNHMDFHPRNIIINDKTGDITFIDFEMSGFAYTYYDLSAFFICKKFFDVLGFTTQDEPELTPEVRKLYLDFYLDAMLEAEETTGRREVEAELLDLGHNIVGMAATLQLMAMGFTMVDTEINEQVDFLKMMPIVTGEYHSGKSMLVSWKDRYLELKEQS